MVYLPSASQLPLRLWSAFEIVIQQMLFAPPSN